MSSDMNLIESLINQIPVITPIFIGACAIFHNGKMAQRRATIDVILQENNNVTLQESKFLIYTKYQSKPLIDLYRDRENEDRKN